MSNKTDGNLAALNAYEIEQDKLTREGDIAESIAIDEVAEMEIFDVIDELYTMPTLEASAQLAGGMALHYLACIEDGESWSDIKAALRGQLVDKRLDS